MLAVTSVNWQPHLSGTSLRLRPLAESDFDALFAAASDPLIWEVHPDRLRYTRERFEAYFRSGIESRGALAVLDLKSGKIIGSSRYTSYNPQTSSVEIGYSFLTRDHWGGDHNRELKTLMLNYAFQHVETAYFVVGRDNLRSRKAMTKIGGLLVTDLSETPVVERTDPFVVFQIAKKNWSQT
ncbi:MAG: N-acetyltransferase [Bdellovibrio sp.]|nr:MAG: N-acetyltransferase [Bdellovibrio sp.]